MCIQFSLIFFFHDGDFDGISISGRQWMHWASTSIFVWRRLGCSYSSFSWCGKHAFFVKHIWSVTFGHKLETFWNIWSLLTQARPVEIIHWKYSREAFLQMKVQGSEWIAFIQFFWAPFLHCIESNLLLYRILDWRIGLRNLSLLKAWKSNWGVDIRKRSSFFLFANMVKHCLFSSPFLILLIIYFS